MDCNEIISHPVGTPKELLAKMDFLLGAIRQWSAGGETDGELLHVILHRLAELHGDMDVMDDCTPVEGDAVMRKMDEIKAVTGMLNSGTSLSGH